MAAAPAVRVAVAGAAGTAGGCALPGLADAAELGVGDGPEDAGGLGEGPGDGVSPGDDVELARGDGLSVAVAADWSVEVRVAGQAGGTRAAHTAPMTASVLSTPMSVVTAMPGRRQ